MFFSQNYHSAAFLVGGGFV